MMSSIDETNGCCGYSEKRKYWLSRKVWKSECDRCQLTWVALNDNCQKIEKLDEKESGFQFPDG